MTKLALGLMPAPTRRVNKYTSLVASSIQAARHKHQEVDEVREENKQLFLIDFVNLKNKNGNSKNTSSRTSSASWRDILYFSSGQATPFV